MKLSFGSFSVIFLCLSQFAATATVFFPVTLTWTNRTVAGVVRRVIAMNGQYPGPPLNINQGDNVQFLVDNRCPFNATVHFHGLCPSYIPTAEEKLNRYRNRTDWNPLVRRRPWRLAKINLSKHDFPLYMDSRSVRSIFLSCASPWIA
jgi:hypothetical protein